MMTSEPSRFNEIHITKGIQSSRMNITGVETRLFTAYLTIAAFGRSVPTCMETVGAVTSTYGSVRRAVE
jgi:hypothetical protein